MQSQITPPLFWLGSARSMTTHPRPPRYSCQVTIHGWLRVDMPRATVEQTFTAGTFRPGDGKDTVAGMRRLDCSLNATLNSNIPADGQQRSRAVAMHVLEPLPARCVAAQPAGGGHT